MLNFVITPLAAVALGAAALGLAGAAAAFPNTGTAADVVDNLTAEGYNVQVNGLVQVAAEAMQRDGRPPHARCFGDAAGKAAYAGLRRRVVPLARLTPRRPTVAVASIRS